MENLISIPLIIYLIFSFRTRRHLNKDEKSLTRKLHRKYQISRYLQYLVFAIVCILLIRFEIIIINNFIYFIFVPIIFLSGRQQFKIFKDYKKLNLPLKYINEIKILSLYTLAMTVLYIYLIVRVSN